MQRIAVPVTPEPPSAVRVVLRISSSQSVSWALAEWNGYTRNRLRAAAPRINRFAFFMDRISFLLNFRFQLCLVSQSPSWVEARAQGRAWGPARFLLAVPITHRVSFPEPSSLAADTDFHSLSSAVEFTLLSVPLLVRQRQRGEARPPRMRRCAWLWRQKKTPLCSVPNCAKLVCVVAGSDSKWKPCPVSGGVVTETALVAKHSKKSPRNLFVESLNPITLRVTPLHSIFIEWMMALKIPSACAGSKLLGTVKTSNTEQTLCTSSSAIPRLMCTFPLPSG